MARRPTKPSRQAPKVSKKEPVYESSSEESEEEEYLSLKENKANRDDSEEEDEVFNLDGVDDEDEDDDEEDDEEDDSDNDEDASDDEEDENAEHLNRLVNNLPANLRQKIVQGKSISDSDDEESDEEEMETSWGKKKKNYYTGDTADLEIGQEFEDAEDEEEEAKELYKSAMANKLESDFIDDDGEESEEEYEGEKDDLMVDLEALAKGQHKGKASVEKITRDINKLSKKQRLDLITKESPELLALTEELKQRITELKHKITPLRELYSSTQTDGVEDELAQYLEVKQQLMLSYCVNIVFYLAMKAEGRSVAAHPVMKRLLELRYIIEKMRPIDGKLKYQIDRFLTTPVAEQSSSHPNLKAMMDDDSDSSEEEEVEKSNVYRPPKMQAVYYEHENKMEKMDKKMESKRKKIKNSEIMETLNEEFGHAPEVSSSSGIATKSRTEKELAEEENERRNFEEERFIRLTLSRKDKKSIKKRQAEAKQNDLLGDIGDIGDFDELADLVSQTETASTKAAPSSSLNAGNITAAMQKAVNSFAQTNKKQKLAAHDDVEDSLSEAAALMKAKRKAKMQAAAVEEDAMEAYDEYDAMLNDRKRRRAPEMDEESVEQDFGREYSSDDDNLVEDFAKLKKGFQKEKKDHYTVDAKYGGREEIVEDGKRRAATYEIMTNRGLRPHRPKENRNPRVKKRLAYGKAVKARKGQVREAVAGAAGSYGGEMTGIKSGISRSRKIGN